MEGKKGTIEKHCINAKISFVITLVAAAWTAVKLPNVVLRPLTADKDIVPFSAI